MNTFKFSPSTLGFYPVVDLAMGLYNPEPDDLVDVDDEVVKMYQGNPPEGMMRGATDEGQPTWVPLPPPTEADIEMANRSLYNTYYIHATNQIELLTDATDPDVMGDDVLPEDVALLKAWKAYRVKLSRITDFVNPVWPVMPDA